MSAPVHPVVTLLLTAMALALGGCATTSIPAPATSPMTASPTAPTAPLVYPAATRGTVTDTYGTTVVTDPYRWMEDPASPELRAWITAENRLSGEFLARVPGRERLTTRLTALWNYERYGAALQGAREFELPFRRGGRYFYLRNDGLQNQSVLYVTDSLEAPPRVLLDPNALSQDATVALADYEISPDGRVLAYATSDGGTDWKTWHFREVATARDLADELRQTKFTSVSWTPDSRAVYYSRYPVDTAGHGDDSRQVVVFRHALGTSQEADARVYAVENHATRDPYAEITDDGRYLLVRLDEGFETNGFDYLDLKHPGAGFRPLFDRWDGLYGFLGNRGSELFFTTTQGAPRGRVIAIDVAARPATVRTVVPESASALTAASLVGGVLIAQYLEDAHSVVKRFALDGEARGALTLPGSGTVTGFYGPEDSAETFYAYTDYVTPRSIYRYDVATDTSTLFRRPRLAIDLDRYVSRQVFYTSKDGTRVPMSIVSRRDLVLDGRQPTLLYGYGGFSVPLTPGFSVPIAVWLEMGGVYAVANLRGGSEYGEDWHLAGTRLRKQNVFDDFIAAAEWLIAQGYTSPDRLAIQGRSNGGLLVGAVMLQRPALFGAALPGVGVLDMLRYHTASANARQWSSDYGLSEDPAEFAALRAYSPVHNVREGACYPPTLITTADHDDRVVPWHSFKFAAALQHAQGCDKPVLIRVETRAGHGGGKPTWMQIEDWVDQWSFLIATLHLQPTLP